MIGQKHNISMIDKWVADGCPQFFCIVGSRGGGKRMLAQYIAGKLGMSYSEVGIKVDEVRETIESANRYGGFYIFADADTMSSNAKNALLKITEEPPKNSYFVVTVQDESSLLDTIKSRAQMIRLEPYTSGDLSVYGAKFPNCDLLNLAITVASTPLEMDLIMQYETEFIDYVNLVIDNIREVEPANAFKSAGKLALKNEEDKYDLSVFFGTVLRLCRQRIGSPVTNAEYIARLMIITTKYYTKSFQLGVNKGQLYDSWVFEVRSIE